MRIVLNRERLVGALVEVPLADALAMPPPASGVRRGEPLHEGPQLARLPRLEQQMPMVGHEAIGQQPHGMFFERVSHDAQKSEIILVGPEDLLPAIGPIQDMINQAPPARSERFLA